MIETKRLFLRDIESSDLENIFRGLSNPAVIKYYGISFSSLEATKEQMIWFKDLERNGTGKWWAICDKESFEFIGAGGFNNLSEANKKAEIGFWLLPEFWGLGYMQEAMPTICKLGFNNLEMHRIEGFVDTKNARCKTAIEKLGFKLEGTMRDAEIKNGEFISTDIYSKLNE